MRVSSAARITRPSTPLRTFADVLSRLAVSADRVRFDIKPGRATVSDLIKLQEHDVRLYELADGFLIEKVMGTKESYIAMALGRYIGNFLEIDELGFVLGPDGAMRIMPHLGRMPDVSFISWLKRPDRTVPDEPVSDLFPDLAVEVLSRRNTKREMRRKLREYFQSGVRLAWIVDPQSRAATVYADPDGGKTLSETDSLTGGDVLPGFSVPLKKLFARLGPRRRPDRRRKS
jgi:Uma2 family endonuclease